MSTKETFSRNLRELCDQTGKTDSSIADDLGVSKVTISDWTTGKSIPRMNKIEALAEYFNCTKADLLEEKKDEKGTYYYDKETQEIIVAIRDNETLRSICSIARKLSEHELQMIKMLVESLVK